MNVYSYLRVSGRSQVDGDGSDRQREAIKGFCEAHRLNIVTEFFEKAVSGTVEGMDRPVFGVLMTCAEEYPGGIDAIVVERVDRLARDLMVSELLLAECRKRNIKVFSADTGALHNIAENGGDPTRVLIRQIMAALSQWDKSVLVIKLKVARERAKARGGRGEGVIAYGRANSAERATLDILAKLCQLEPRPTSRVIAGMLNDAGFKNRAGNSWTFQHVCGLIKANKL